VRRSLDVGESLAGVLSLRDSPLAGLIGTIPA
jgi:hypothetical protein